MLNPETGGFTSTLLDLTKDTLTPTILRDLTTNPFCAGHAQAADGSVWLFGGDRQNSSNPEIGFNLENGIEGRRRLVPTSGGDGIPKWENEDIHGIMDGKARWYPTVVTMYDGVFAIFSGTTTNLDFNELGKNKNPTYEYYPPKKSGNLRTLELLEWAYPHVLYPVSFQLPSKKIFLMVSNRTVLIDRQESGDVITEIKPLVAENHEPWIYPNTPTAFLLPMYEETGYKAIVVVCGGVQKDTAMASPQCYSIDADTPGADWKREPDMPRGRVMPDSALLPDGTVLLTNGARWGVAGGNAGQAQYCAGPWFDADIYNPSTSTWTASVGRMTVPRLYHSGAILLEDGSVIATGSEMQNYQDVWGPDETNVVSMLESECYPNRRKDDNMEYPLCVGAANPYEMRIETFYPPYIASTRPIIKAAPQTITYTSTILLTLDPTIPVSSISLIRYTTTTHSTNTDQRFLSPKLLFNNGSHVIFRVPPHGGVAPPGNYHLFVVTKEGVPSVATRVLIGDGDVSNVEVPAGPGVTGAPSGGGVTATVGSNSVASKPSGALRTVGGGFGFAGFVGLVLGIVGLI
ncbi:hypothetical protein HDU67_000209 [Dinochytrium kinnereticum]|nr:hypothetical protein HDU67_000209 [Dinochytrium kinnereticum]